MAIDQSTTVGPVHLTISDLDRSIRFYEAHLGLTLHQKSGRSAGMGVGEADLLVLSQCESAPRVRGTTGLYHFAVLVPSRFELARGLQRLIETDTVLQGSADHGVSEALYLADADGNGIEIYRDRPRAEWPMAGGRLRMTSDPLDLEDLLRELTTRPPSHAPLPAGTVIGHVHLHVSHLDEAERFYVGVLGFDLMQRYGTSALFVSAGGYHHHVGLNTWTGVGAPPPPAGAIGLRHVVVRLPSPDALASVLARVREAGIPTEPAEDGVLVRDPASNALLLVGGDP